MTPTERQEALRQKNVSQRAIAIRLKVSPMLVSNVIRGKSVSDRVMRAISLEIGRPHTEVFPEYYLAPKRRPGPQPKSCRI